MKKLEFYFHV